LCSTPPPAIAQTIEPRLSHDTRDQLVSGTIPFSSLVPFSPPSLPLYVRACRSRRKRDEKECRLRLGEATTTLESSTTRRGGDGVRRVGELWPGHCYRRDDIFPGVGELDRPGRSVRELELRPPREGAKAPAGALGGRGLGATSPCSRCPANPCSSRSKHKAA
jgi:hypothetical protein